MKFPKITLHVFVCDSENCMEKLFGNYFLEIAFQLHKVVFSELISRYFPIGVYNYKNYSPANYYRQQKLLQSTVYSEKMNDGLQLQ